MEIIIGIISGMFTAIGMGGGTVLILLLTLILGISQLSAQGINLIFFIPTAVTSIILNFKNKNIDLKISLYIIFFGIIGSIVGTILSNKVEVNMLRKYFGIFLLIIGLHEIYNFYKQYIKNKITHTKIEK